METTDKTSCQILIDVIKAHGVKNIVVSPGSRNTPLIIAVARDKDFQKTIIVDERSAAFVALGMCAANNGETPIALICTSGSALLNYAPAISEAYYRNLPLIVISADRPAEWIDQDDSQTIRQFEALSNYVKKSYNIPTQCDSKNLRWFVNRIVNDALICSKSGRKGPVHINIQFDEPLNNLAKISGEQQRIINSSKTTNIIDEAFLKENIINKLKSKKVLIIAGFQNCENTSWVNHSHKSGESILDKFINNHTNAFLLTESIANIKSNNQCCNIDRVISYMSEEDKCSMKPDIVITFGGALVSRFVKQYLREYNPTEHWHIGITDNIIDCFQSLTMRIDTHPNVFFQQINSISHDINTTSYSSYQRKWLEIANKAESSHDKYIANCNWSDLKAFSIILPNLSGDLHLSNGTPIRYQQLFNPNKNISHIYCNRGVSGIDGCTSTAIGHALVSQCTTTLISGDLSAQYDLNALSFDTIPPNFKMIIMCNGGGGIFRFIKSTSSLPEVNKYFAVNNHFPIKEIALGYNISYFSANNEDELKTILPTFLQPSNRPTILAIYTPAQESATILKNYFNRKNI